VRTTKLVTTELVGNKRNCCCVFAGWLWLWSSFVSPLCKIF